MKINIKATVLVYSIVLTWIGLILAVVVLNNHSALILNQKYTEIEKSFYNNIKFKTSITARILKDTNSDGSWFIDDYTWSWSNIECILQWDLSYLVEWSSWSILWSDWIDDNCDDDNYLWTNSWWTDYPNNFLDNDDYARKTIEWYIAPSLSQNIFWNNHKIEDFIDKNSNNTSLINDKLWVTSNGSLFLDITEDIEIKIFEINKTLYTGSWVIKKTATFTWSLSTWSWYLERTGSTIQFSNLSNSYAFDFTTHDYMIFIQNNSDTNVIKYTLKWENQGNNNPLYLNPIDDSNNILYKILWYDVTINSEWTIVWKLLEITWQK